MSSGLYALENMLRAHVWLTNHQTLSEASYSLQMSLEDPQSYVYSNESQVESSMAPDTALTHEIGESPALSPDEYLRSQGDAFTLIMFKHFNREIDTIACNPNEDHVSRAQ